MLRSYIRCECPQTGQIATFIGDDNREPLSPLFNGLYELIPWMKQNGFVWDEYEGRNFIPWRVKKL